MLSGQENRFIRFMGSAAQSLIPLFVEGEERISAPYRWRVDFRSSLTPSATAAFLGKELACQIGDGKKTRLVQGVVTAMDEHTDAQGAPLYTATLEPRLALLDLGSNLAVFQNISVPDLVCQILRRNDINHIELRLHASYQPREYCIQYRESDFGFINRLLESEGIYYFFSHKADRHTLILADHSSGHHAAPVPVMPWLPIAGKGEGEGVETWTGHATLTAAAVEFRAYSMEQAESVSGESKCNSSDRGVKGVNFADAHGFSLRDQLKSAARLKMEQLEAGTQRAEAQLKAWWLTCGERFSLDAHLSNNGAYNISSLRLQATSNLDGDMMDFQCRAVVFDNASTWRPPETTPVPEIAGILTATVVGPTSEEVHTDKFGRIKIQFPWDRENKHDDSSSCWVRVSQPWSGGRFGGMFIPRIGSEVVVSFVHGHPDYPMVTGTVFNGKNLPPLALPAEKSQSGFISRSVLDGSVEEGHQLRFDDKKGEEKLLLTSQKDLILTVKNDVLTDIANEVKETIGASRTTEITKGNDSLTLSQGNRTLALEQGNLSTSLKQGNMQLSLQKGDYSLDVKGNQKESLSGGNHSLSVSGGGSSVKADKACIIESTQSIELKVGSSKVSITPAGITISGTTIKIEGTATTDLNGAMVTVKGSGMTQVKGGVVMVG